MMVLADGAVVEIVPPRPPVLTMPPPAPSTTTVVPTPGPPGPSGPAGPPGPAFDGKAIWYGNGLPGVVVGAKPGDSYIDLDTGTVYELT